MRTFAEALPPDAKRLIRNYHRRLRYQHALDRPKRFAGNSAGVFDLRKDSAAQEQACLQMLDNPPSTAAYVAAWCWLNQLT